MNPALLTTITVLQIVVFAVLLLPTIYILVFAFAGLFYRQKAYPLNASLKRIAVLIPGYKEDEVIIEVAKDALAQDNPHGYYDVVIIAESFQTDTIAMIIQYPIKLLEVKFQKSTNT